ncbi:MAG: hypothetical protein ABSD59_00790 [Terracidiphilus sp.]|jgi:hypothetical protein
MGRFVASPRGVSIAVLALAVIRSPAQNVILQAAPLPDPKALLQRASAKQDMYAQAGQKYICVFKSKDFITGKLSTL